MNLLVDPFAPWEDPDALAKYNEELKSGEVD
jgi:hypothetical protein